MKIYKGNLEINKGDTTDYSDLEQITGYLSIDSSANLKNLKSVGGKLFLSSKLSLSIEKQLWGANRKDPKKIWRISNLCSEWLIEKVGSRENSEFYINNVQFNFEWFNKIRKDQLSPEEIFAIDNLEHRRIAYEMMDKTKMKSLKDYKVLDEATDNYKNPMKVISFSVKGVDEPLKYLNVFCPTTNREYFIGTAENKCEKAKAKSFGFDKLVFNKEW